MRKAVEYSGAQLLGAAFGLNAALVCEGAIAIECNCDQRSNGIVRQWAGVAADDKRADRDRAKANDSAPDAGFRIIVGALKVIDVLRKLLWILAPDAGRIHVVQIRIKERNRL